MMAMVNSWVVDAIKKRSAGTITLHRKIRTVGIIESVLYERIAELIDTKPQPGRGARVDVAFLPTWKGVDIRLTTETADEPDSRRRIEELEGKIKEKIGKYIYGYDNDTLPQIVGDLLREKRLKVAVAESCTGGLLGKMITDVPGSSDYFAGGIIAYSNESKMKLLSVPQIIIEKYGGVSEECARYMAEGAARNLEADIGVGVTGIAGPSGGSDEKPVGLLYIGLSVSGKTAGKEFRLGTERERNRERSAVVALDSLRRYLQKSPE
jgi:nicotinamide-nucleotide amidase